MPLLYGANLAQLPFVVGDSCLSQLITSTSTIDFARLELDNLISNFWSFSCTSSKYLTLRRVDWTLCTKVTYHTTMLSECLSNHKPYIKMPKRQTKKAGCVLTSYESRQILGKKEVKRRKENAYWGKRNMQQNEEEAERKEKRNVRQVRKENAI